MAWYDKPEHYVMSVFTVPRRFHFLCEYGVSVANVVSSLLLFALQRKDEKLWHMTDHPGYDIDIIKEGTKTLIKYSTKTAKLLALPIAAAGYTHAR